MSVYKLEKELDPNLPNHVIVESCLVDRNLLANILAFIQPQDWNSVKLTCKAFLNVSNSMHLPKYHEKCWDNTTSKISFESALFLIREKVLPGWAVTREFLRQEVKPGHPERNSFLFISALILPLFQSREFWDVKIDLLKATTQTRDEQLLGILLTNCTLRPVELSGILTIYLEKGDRECFKQVKNFYIKHGKNPLFEIECDRSINKETHRELFDECWPDSIEQCQEHWLRDVMTPYRYLVTTPNSGKQIDKIIHDVKDRRFQYVWGDLERFVESLFKTTLLYDNVQIFDLWIDKGYIKLDERTFDLVMSEMQPNTTRRLLQILPSCYKLKRTHLIEAIDVNLLDVLKRLLDDNNKKYGKIGYVDMVETYDELIRFAIDGDKDEITEYLLKNNCTDLRAACEKYYGFVCANDKFPKTLFFFDNTITTRRVVERLKEKHHIAMSGNLNPFIKKRLEDMKPLNKKRKT
jgi:hypothetical protein